MTGRMNWRKAQLHGRPTTDHRFEEEQLARAERWRRARRHNAQRGQQTMMLSKPVPADPRIYRSAVCKVTIIELPQAQRYRRVFGILQAKAPDHVPERRWNQCIADGSRFLARWGLEAQRLGWSSADLFGLVPVPDKPHPSFNRMARLDTMGLCWVLLGRRVTALTADAATIENAATGSRTVYRKHSKPLGAVGR